MTEIESIELLRGITSRLVGLFGVCLILAVLSYVAIERITTKPKLSTIVMADPNVNSETYLQRNDSENFIYIATDGEKTITRIDSRRFTWVVSIGLIGIALGLFRWPIAGLIIPNSTSEQVSGGNGGQAR